MDNWCNVLKILFKKISAKEILEGKIQYQNVDRNIFESLVKIYIPSYSGNDAANLYDYASNVEYKNTQVRAINVIEVLRRFDETVLKEIEQMPVCRYRYLLKWRMVSFDLDEELFTTSFLAFEDRKKGRSDRDKFDWKYIIGNDNVELNDMLKKGLAENHFHLKGSAPYFSMSWINLMNRVSDKNFINTLKKYDDNRLQGFTAYHSGAAENSLVDMCLQAALIRAYLYSCIENIGFSINDKCYIGRDMLSSYVDWSLWDNEDDILLKIKEKCSEEEKKLTYVSKYEIIWQYLKSNKKAEEKQRCDYLFQNMFNGLNIENIVEQSNLTELGIIQYLWQQVNYVNVSWEFIHFFVKKEDQEELSKIIERRNVLRVLNDKEMLLEVRDNLQLAINEFRMRGNRKYDYAGEVSYNKEVNIFGERWLLYKMFKGIAEKRSEYLVNGNLFYAYLIIKERIRSELIQVNEVVGFDNFFRYQNRKEEFIDGTSLANIYSKTAIKSSLQGQNILKLEARITPRNSSVENRRYIAKLDKSILEGNRELEKRYFYVFHFIKELEPRYVSGELACRHYKLRNKVKIQAMAIQNMRMKYPREGSRVLGIDASAMEIGCRPEIFAQAYRYLQYEQSSNLDERGEKMPRLHSTYHVGEDFLDIIDGMRAIEEAIYYLNLTHGDRLGHALALGIIPKEWYQFKGNRVLCSRQDLLDNIMWLYHRIRRYNIIAAENILLKLERYFTREYNAIYDINEKEPCDINVYYDAWKLRGDNPSCYHYDGSRDAQQDLDWESYNYNNKYEELETIRNEKRCTKLFYRYHYDEDVKNRGKEIVEFKIEPELIRVVEKVQLCLQKEVLDCGLGIETNPSSNYLIGTFRSYAKHPIVNWYNKKLTYDKDSLANCTQLDVTINTDDQAVFGTSLENEYALLAIALEKARDEQGNLCYKKDMIYDWLNDIREIGLTRSFKKD